MQNHRIPVMCRPYYYSYVIDGAFLHRINFEALTWNGGYVRINNYDLGSTPSVDARKYYVSATKIHRPTLTIDLIDPYHCSEMRTCTENMLDRGPPITKSVSSLQHTLYCRTYITARGGHFLSSYM